MERIELEAVVYEKEGPIARIILNRPEKPDPENSSMLNDILAICSMTPSS